MHIERANRLVGGVATAHQEPGGTGIAGLEAGDGEPVDRLAGARVQARNEAVVRDQPAAAEVAELVVEELSRVEFVGDLVPVFGVDAEDAALLFPGAEDDLVGAVGRGYPFPTK
jgi:hypothetical protein